MVRERALLRANAPASSAKTGVPRGRLTGSCWSARQACHRTTTPGISRLVVVASDRCPWATITLTRVPSMLLSHSAAAA